MRLLDITLPQPVDNLALDEVLLDQAEASAAPTELLRIWESPSPMVVIGRASKIALEVNIERCRELGLPIYRRCSGGTSVVAGPGCLMYAVILSYDLYPQLRQLNNAHRFVMTRIQSALATLDPRVRYQGTCDLTVSGRKISGNALRCKRSHLLYHGTVLYDFPLPLITSVLRGGPPRQPDYRKGRSHHDFVANFGHAASEIQGALVAAWQADVPPSPLPLAEVSALVERQYSQDSWNFRF